jgi:hypothetical protein
VPKVTATDDEREVEQLCVELKVANREDRGRLREGLKRIRLKVRFGKEPSMTINSNLRLKELCEQIAKEENAQKFAALVQELNELLEGPDFRRQDSSADR